MTIDFLPEGAGPCVKAHVTATLVTKSGQRFRSTNFCMSPVDVCPRVTWNYGPGEGYHLCKQICDQPEHAEMNVMHFARKSVDIAGSTVYVEYGDNTGKVKPWICHACAGACKCNDVYHVLGAPPAEDDGYLAHNQRAWGQYQASRKAVLGLA